MLTLLSFWIIVDTYNVIQNHEQNVFFKLIDSKHQQVNLDLRNWDIFVSMWTIVINNYKIVMSIMN